MSNRHFAELGDVWKHLPLAEVLRLNPPRAYWETHAGSPFYPLSASPARLHGALRFLSCAPFDPDLLLSSYLEALQAQRQMYPGSPTLALRQLGNNASYIFCDTDPESAAGLRTAGTHHRVRVVEGDGVSAIVREAERMEFEPRDVLVHIDPYDPHERLGPDALTPLELAASLAQRGYRLFYWYGYESVANRGWARHAISRLAPGTELWCGDMLMPACFVYPEQDGAWGCGIVLANMSTPEATTCARLGMALERMSLDDLAAHNEPTCLSFRVIAAD